MSLPFIGDYYSPEEERQKKIEEIYGPRPVEEPSLFPGKEYQPEKVRPTYGTGTYWEDPERLARYYMLTSTLPEGEAVPEWIPVNEISQAWEHFSSLNPGKSWWEWSALDPNDPVSIMLQGLATPPNEALWPGEERFASMVAEGAAPIADVDPAKMHYYGLSEDEWNALDEWQRWSLRIFSTGAGSGAFSGMMGVGAEAAIRGVAESGLSGLLGGAIKGGGAGAGLGLVLGFASEKVPWLAALFEKLDILAEGVERVGGLITLTGLGMMGDFERYFTGSTSLPMLTDIYKNLDAAWQAGHLLYDVTSTEAFGGKEAWNIAQPSEEWTLSPEETGHAALIEAFNRLASGEEVESVYEDIIARHGFQGQMRDMVGHMLADPLNFAGLWMKAPLAFAAKIAKNSELMKALQVSSGPVEAIRKYGTFLRTTTDVEKVPTLEGWTGWLGRKLAGVTEEGKNVYLDPIEPPKHPILNRLGGAVLLAGPAAVIGSAFGGVTGGVAAALFGAVGGARLGGGYLMNLTPVARASELVNSAAVHMLSVLERSKNARDAVRMVESLKNTPHELAVELGMTSLKSASAAAIPKMLASVSKKVKDLLVGWETTAWSRGVVENIAAVMGKSAEDILVQLERGNPDTLLMRFVDKARTMGNDAAKNIVRLYDGGELTGVHLQEMVKSFVKDGMPYTFDLFKGQLFSMLTKHSADWAATWFDVKPDALYMRLGNTMKAAQSLILLGLNPSYLVNNALNNVITMALDGLGFRPVHKVDQLFGRIGYEPPRSGAGLGAAGEGAIDIEPLRKATQVKGPLGSIERGFQGLSNRIGLATKASSAVEAFSSRQAFAAAFSKFWGRVWRPGDGFRRMPEALEQALGPERADLVYSAIKGGMNQAEIEAALWKEITHRPIDSIMSSASETMGRSEALVRETLMQAGIYDHLKEGLEQAKGPEDIRKAYTETFRKMEGILNEMADRAAEVEAQQAFNSIVASGMQEVLNLFADTEMTEARRWIDNFDDWELLYSKQDETDPAIFRAQVHEQYRIEDGLWARMRKTKSARYMGMAKALGRGSDVAKQIIGKLADSEKVWKEFYAEKRRMIQQFYDTEFSSKRTRDAAWKEIERRLDQLYRDTADNDTKITDALDELVGKEIELQIPGALDQFKVWRKEVRDIRAEMVEKMRAFRRSLAEQDNLSAREKRVAWTKFIDEDIKPLIVKRMQANINGSVETYIAGRDNPAPLTHPANIRPETHRVLSPILDRLADYMNEPGPKKQEYIWFVVTEELNKLRDVTQAITDDPAARSMVMTIIDDYEASVKSRLGSNYDTNDYWPEVFNSYRDAIGGLFKEKTTAEGVHPEFRVSELTAKMTKEMQSVKAKERAQAWSNLWEETTIDPSREYDPAYPMMTRERLREQLGLAFDKADEAELDAFMEVLDARAVEWGKANNRAPGDWYREYIAGLESQDIDGYALQYWQMTKQDVKIMQLTRMISDLDYTKMSPAIKEAVGEAAVKLLAVIEDAEPGQKVFVDGKYSHSIESTYPSWYSEKGFGHLTYIDKAGNRYKGKAAVVSSLKEIISSEVHGAGKQRTIVQKLLDLMYGDIMDSDAFRLAIGGDLDETGFAAKMWDLRKEAKNNPTARNLEFLFEEASRHMERLLTFYEGREIPTSLLDDLVSTQNLIQQLQKEMGAGGLSELFQTQLARYAELPSFARWFGNSQWADAEGRPLFAYHGTRADFDSFAKPTKGGLLGKGIYFTPDPEFAGVYALGGPGGKIIPVYLRIENPLRIDYRTSDGLRLFTEIDANPNYLLDNGYDGLIFTDATGKISEIVVVDPTQIKSPFNVGTWDPADARVLHQEAGNHIKGSVKFLDDGRAVIRALNGSDISTVVHEAGHIFRRQLSAADHEIAAKWAGAVWDEAEAGWAWTREAEEKFAKGFEQYLREGQAPTKALQAVFDRFKEWLTDIYARLRGNPLVKVDKRMRGVYDRLLAGTEIASREGGKVYVGNVEASSIMSSLDNLLDRGNLGFKLQPGQANAIEAAIAGGSLQELAGSMWDVFSTRATELPMQASASRFAEYIAGDIGGLSSAEVALYARWEDSLMRMYWKYAKTQNPGTLFGPPEMRAAFERYTGTSLDDFDMSRMGKVVETENGPATMLGGGEYISNGTLNTPLNDDPPAAIGMPAGTIEGMNSNPPLWQMTEEAWHDFIKPVLQEMERQHTGPEGVSGFKLGPETFDQETYTQLLTYLETVYSQQAEQKFLGLRLAEQARDFSLLNYTQRTGIENVAQTIFPYIFWYTHYGMNWASRAIDKPAYLAHYARFKRMQANSSREIEGFPARLQGKMQIAYLPKSVGGVYIDPMHQLFPLEQLFRPVDRLLNQYDQQGQRAIYILMDKLANEEISEAELQEALQTGNDLWEEAFAEAELVAQGEIGNFWDFANLISGPTLPLSIAYNLKQGKEPSLTPLARTWQSITAWMKPGGSTGIEGWLRDSAGFKEKGELWDYYAIREITNMVMGGMDVNEALRAMADRGGEVWERAIDTVGKQQSLKNFASALWLDFFPEGEAGQRALQGEFYKAVEEGNLSAFFDKYPQYRARLELRNWNDPEEMMRSVLRGEIWEAWNNLEDLEKKVVKEQLGELFVTAFLTKETRAYDQITTETLVQWARNLNAEMPATAPGVPQGQGLTLPTAGQSQAYNTYLEVKGSKYANIGNVESLYYSLPEGMQHQFRLNNPILQEYWDWRDTFIADNPELIPYLVSENNKLYGVDPVIQEAVYQYRAERARYFPMISAAWDYYGTLTGKDKSRFWDEHPELEAYIEWQKQYLARNPEIIPYVKGSESIAEGVLGENYQAPYQVDVRQFPSELIESMFSFVYSNQALGPGALAMLQNIWKAEGMPFGSFEDWLEFVLDTMRK